LVTNISSKCVKLHKMEMLKIKINKKTLKKTYSPKGLLGTPVQFLINAIIYSTNHMVVASMHLRVWSWSRQSPELQTGCQNGKER